MDFKTFEKKPIVGEFFTSKVILKFNHLQKEPHKKPGKFNIHTNVNGSTVTLLPVLGTSIGHAVYTAASVSATVAAWLHAAQFSGFCVQRQVLLSDERSA
jgi:hypothetical protein